jgi:hypothetical protein
MFEQLQADDLPRFEGGVQGSAQRKYHPGGCQFSVATGPGDHQGAHYSISKSIMIS